jgi:tetratricopeptide (TPR) repeat protein
MQALVNLHGYNDGLEAFRQFDASGELLYEQCRGNDVSGLVNLALEPWDLPYQPGNGGNEASLAAYNRCFETVPRTATRYLDPRVELAAAAGRDPETTRRTTDPHARIADLGQRIDGGLDDAALLVERGDAYFQVREFELAVIDYDSALRLDDGLDAAYFGRGMALGRMGRIDAGIADLTTYIERQPQSSVAYTKRGIRHFWNGDHDRAEHDFLQALELDPGNAEAHDDLGVILALRGDRKDALTHFHAAIRLEPEYQKAHHNLALVLHMEGREAPALAAVDNALALRPEARESLQLKGAILAGLGRDTEARIINERAANLPEADWSERAQLR